MKHTRIAILAAVVLILSLAGAASAQNTPNPDTGDLGFGSEDVRDEPNHPFDDNGFPESHPGDFWSPKGPNHLILESYYIDTAAGAFNNYLNQLVYGNNYDQYQSVIIPGSARFPAYWGWWNDIGSGGDLRNHSATNTAPLTGDGDGAIQDNSDDCRKDDWDEFVWRGTNNCANEAGNPYSSYGDDSLWVFAQPGTWDGNVNGAVAILDSDDDKNRQADFRLEDETGGGDGPWGMPNGFGRIAYDQSLLMTTRITTAANPPEANQGAESFKPFSTKTTAVDVDIYSALNAEIEDAYRTTVWDPPQNYGDGDDEENAFSTVHEQGPKQYAKEEALATVASVTEPALGTYWSTLNSTQRQRGVAENTIGKRPDKHEPNTPLDEYGLKDTDGDGTNETFKLATYDEASYGGLDGQYYEPGPKRDYKEYEEGAHTWLDAQQEWSVPVWGGLLMGINSYNFHPSAKGIQSQNQNQQNTQAPGLLHQRLFVGLWHDKNQDHWVGGVENKEYDPNEEPIGRQSSLLIPYERWYDVSKGPQSQNDPYADGTDSDPNNYWNTTEWTGIDGSGNVNISITLVPDNPQQRWGDAGVYFLTGAFNPYSPAVSDALGDAPDPVMEPLRNNPEVGGLASYALPDDEHGRLSNYRTHGPITMNVTHVTAVGHSGHFRTTDAILFPTGSLDYRVKSTVTLENRDTNMKGSGDTADQKLTGEIIKDVDFINSMT